VGKKEAQTSKEAEETDPEVAQALPVLGLPLSQLLPVRLEPSIPPVHNML